MELIDSSDNSLTVSWPEVAGAKRYVLQYRKDTSSDEVVFETLSETLATTQARKRNLSGSFFFRAGAIVEEEQSEPLSWVTHQEAFQALTTEQEASRMPQPVVQSAGNHAVKVSWTTVDGASGYELQMRENKGGERWNTIGSSLSSTEVRKKNLTSNSGYMFRVRVAGSGSAFSIASEVAVGGSVSEGIKKVFSMVEDGKLLINPTTPVLLADALASKEFVLLYASAHWCPPCRQFTPMLMKWYQQMKNTVEVVFLSADHDEKGFSSYYASMPWAAVPFDDDGREQLMGYIKVTGIPRLVVLDGKTGRTIVDNAVGQPLDINSWRKLASKGKG